MTNSFQAVLVGCSARSAAQSLVSSGWEVIAIDQFADRDLMAIAEAISVENFANDVEAALEPYLGLPIIPVGGMENQFEMIERIASRHLWCGVTADLLRFVRDPAYVGMVAGKCGLNSPRRRSAIDTLQPAITSPTSMRWLWKPFASGGGQGVHFIPEGDLGASNGYRQQWIDGQSLGATLIVNRIGEVRVVGCCSSCCGVDFPNNNPFIFRGSHGPVVLNEPHMQALQAFGKYLAGEHGYRGLMQIDLILDHESKLWVLEINPRWSASMEVLEQTVARNLLADHLAAYGFDPPIQREAAGAMHIADYAWKEIFYAEKNFLFDDGIDRLLTTLVANRSDGVSTFVADLPKIGTRFSPGDPIFTVVISGLRREVVQERLKLFRECWQSITVLGDRAS